MKPRTTHTRTTRRAAPLSQNRCIRATRGRYEFVSARAKGSRASCLVDGEVGGPRATSRRTALHSLVASLVFANSQAMGSHASDEKVDWASLADDAWKKRLSPDAYKVLRKAATELPFSSPLNKEYRPGTFLCAGCKSPLFDSSAKFNSGTGWPSFTQALPGAVDESEDLSIVFMPRTEVTCHTCHGHLGHVFPDGPEPTGLRYCMNGVALSFEPREGL